MGSLGFARRLALISSIEDGDLDVYDLTARKEFKRVPIRHGAAGIYVQHDDVRAFVACSADNYVWWST